MKRDMDICRELLMVIEKQESAPELMDISLPNVDESTVSYHVKLLHEAGLIEAKNLSGMNSFKWVPTSLTWQGHEFLDAARDATRWDQAKKKVIAATGGLAFEFLKRALLHVAGL